MTDIIGDPNFGPLFDQRVGAPEVATEPRPAPRVATVKGSRGLALERIEPKRESQKTRLFNIYTAIGPCTRNTAAAVLCGHEPPTPEAMNTVQGRTADLKADNQVHVVGYESDTGRELIAVVPLRYSTPTPEPSHAH